MKTWRISEVIDGRVNDTLFTDGIEAQRLFDKLVSSEIDCSFFGYEDDGKLILIDSYMKPFDAPQFNTNYMGDTYEDKASGLTATVSRSGGHRHE